MDLVEGEVHEQEVFDRRLVPAVGAGSLHWHWTESGPILGSCGRCLPGKVNWNKTKSTVVLTELLYVWSNKPLGFAVLSKTYRSLALENLYAQMAWSPSMGWIFGGINLIQSDSWLSLSMSWNWPQ